MAIDGEAGGQFGLGRQARTWRVFLAADLLAQRFRNLPP
jgi:hypothetical protein